jgi:hypothetical protein
VEWSARYLNIVISKIISGNFYIKSRTIIHLIWNYFSKILDLFLIFLNLSFRKLRLFWQLLIVINGHLALRTLGDFNLNLAFNWGDKIKIFALILNNIRKDKI